MLSVQGGGGRVRYRRTLSSVDNALTLLSALRQRPSLAVKEGAELLGVAPSTAHRLLTTLQAHGFVSQDARSRRYEAGPLLMEVALSSLARMDVRRVARPHLVALAAEARETVNLAVAEGRHARFIDSVEGPELIRVTSRNGDLVSAHVTSVGKVLLSGMSDPELELIFPDEHLSGGTERAHKTKTSLLDELARVRETGHAASFEESTVGLSSVAVPIRDFIGNVLAAVGISVPAARLDKVRAGELVAMAGRRARRIEGELSAQTQNVHL